MAGYIIDLGISTVSNGVGVGSYALQKHRYKQSARPYGSYVLPYEVSKRTCVTDIRPSGFTPFSPSAGHYPWYWWPQSTVDWSTDPVAGALARARASFTKKVRATSELAVTIAEHKQAVSMIEKRAWQLAHFASALLRRDVKSAAWYLGLSGAKRKDFRRINAFGRRVGRPRRIEKGSDEFANAVLETSYGWAPLVQDLVSASSVLSEPVMDMVRIRGIASNTSELSGSAISPGQWSDRGVWLMKAKAVVGCTVRVDNPNLGLFSQLGLTNLLSVAWELIPYSFLVDQIVNIGDYVGQYDEFYGLTALDSYNNVKVEGMTDYYVYNEFGTKYLTRHTSGHHRFFERRKGIPDVELGFQLGGLLNSPARAVNNLALLIQKLK